MCKRKKNPKYQEYIQRWNKKNLQLTDLLGSNSTEIESAYDHPEFLIIKQSNPDNIEPAMWGLVPTWIRDREKALKYTEFTQNARNDTIFEKESFKPYIMKQRCLILTEGFVEHRHAAAYSYPYFIYLKKLKCFAMGGLYTEHPDLGNTYAVITTEANPLMAKIHNTKLRMPLMFGNEAAEKAWLNPNATKEDIINMMVPLDESLMAAHTINRDLKNTKPFDYPDLNMFDSMFGDDEAPDDY